jgi:hypothetical protein
MAKVVDAMNKIYSSPGAANIPIFIGVLVSAALKVIPESVTPERM